MTLGSFLFLKEQIKDIIIPTTNKQHHIYRTSANGCAGWRAWSSRRLRGPSDLLACAKFTRTRD